MPESASKPIIDQLRAFSQEQLISKIAAWATNNSLPFIVYRLPHEDHFQIQVGNSIERVDDNDLSILGTGFLFSTYNGKNYFIKEDLTLNSRDRQLQLSTNWPAGTSIDSILDYGEDWQPYGLEDDSVGTSADEYIKNVERCIAEINGSALIKVVPSRTKRIKFTTGKDLGGIFTKLSKAYKNAFVSILSTVEFGTWIGATPETLIEVDANGIFNTMSLAGTQPYNGLDPLHSLPWTQKEIEEQAMVSRYIINRFKEIRLREFEEVGPRTVDAGNMAHLCSTFTVDTIATDHENLGSVMLKLLHPTSAVCGMPKDKAQKLITELEAHDRKLYAGYLGPVNRSNGSHIYVNLRCMEVLKYEAILYAGAGVTAYSNPEEEWEETELKCNTLLNIIEG